MRLIFLRIVQLQKVFQSARIARCHHHHHHHHLPQYFSLLFSRKALFEESSSCTEQKHSAVARTGQKDSFFFFFRPLKCGARGQRESRFRLTTEMQRSSSCSAVWGRRRRRRRCLPCTAVAAITLCSRSRSPKPRRKPQEECDRSLITGPARATSLIVSILFWFWVLLWRKNLINLDGTSLQKERWWYLFARHESEEEETRE